MEFELLTNLFIVHCTEYVTREIQRCAVPYQVMGQEGLI